MDDVCLKHIELWFLTSRKEEQEETFEEVDIIIIENTFDVER